MSLWDDIAERDVPLAPLTTYKLGGAARHLATAEHARDLLRIAHLLKEEPVPVVVLGRGSNVLVSDRGFDGLVVRLGTGFSWVDIGENVASGSATPLPLLARTAAKAGRSGLEFYVGIPGSVGGAVMMNAGCHGSDTKDVLLTVEIVDLGDATRQQVDAAALDLSYRHSNLGPLQVVVHAVFASEAGDPSVCEHRIREITRWRKAHQPGGVLNAGSVFKNPPGDSAGRLIDRAGLKGLTVGGARVSPLHANFIEAGRDATARDVYRLIRSVQATMGEHGVHLEPEVRLLGNFED
jgi:UDP-N-acetylmuramate dehydrogenase